MSVVEKMIALKRYWVRFIAINLEQASAFTRNLVPGRELEKFAFETSWEWECQCSGLRSQLGEAMPVTRLLVPSLNLEIQPFR